jgi:hypothetical protein
MCRKNWVSAAALLGFGAGILAGGLCGSELVRLAVGAAAICAGIWLLRGKC